MNVPMPTNPLVKISPANSTSEDGRDRPAFTLAYQFTTPPPCGKAPVLGVFVRH